MKRRQPENGGEDGDVRHAASKLRALVALGRQLKVGNIIRLSRTVIGKLRLVLREMLQHDDYADDRRVAELLGVMVTTKPDNPTEVPADLADAVRGELVELVADEDVLN